MRVSEIRVKQIRVNQGLGVFLKQISSQCNVRCSGEVCTTKQTQLILIGISEKKKFA